jgi:signal transduction histidine kinase
MNVLPKAGLDCFAFDPSLAKRIIESLSIGVLIWASDGSIVSANQAALALIGGSKSPEDAPNQSGDAEFGVGLRLLRTDGSELPIADRPSESVRRTGQAVTGQVLGLKHPDGELVWVCIDARPIALCGDASLTGVVSTLTDITKLINRRMDETAVSDQLSVATEVGAIGIVRWQISQPVCELDRAAEQILDLPHLDHGCPITALLDRFDRRHHGQIRRVLTNAVLERRRMDISLWITRSDGARRKIRFSTVVSQHADKRQTTVMAMLRDVSSDVELAASRRERDLARQADQRKSDLLARTSHDLRSPLQSILWNAALIASAQQGSSEQVNRSASRILSAGNHLATLVSDVHDAATLSLGRLKIALQPVALAPMCEASIAVNEPIAQRQHIALSVQVPHDIQVIADPTRLRQVLINLVSNAVSYNRTDGSIEIRASANGRRVRIEVADTGRGIAAADIEQIFEPFFRGEQSSSQQGTDHGSGLGLAISRSLVENMGGTLGVRSVIGEGSVFVIELDQAQTDASRPSKAEPLIGGLSASV